MIPEHLLVPWPETHLDRERIREAAIDGFSNQDPSVLTAAFCGLPDNEKHNAWWYLTYAGISEIDFAKFVYKACAQDLLVLYGIPRETTGNVWPNATPNFALGVERMPGWEIPGAKTQANKVETDQ